MTSNDFEVSGNECRCLRCERRIAIMENELKKWAHIERQFLKDDLEWLKAGGKLTSPSGDDITTDQMARLEGRIEHVNALLARASE